MNDYLQYSFTFDHAVIKGSEPGLAHLCICTFSVVDCEKDLLHNSHL